MTDTPASPPVLVPRLVDRLRADLALIEPGAIEDALGSQAAAALRREERTPARMALATAPPALAALVGGFVLGEEVPRQRMAELFPTLGVDGAAQLGLLMAAPGDAVRAAVDLAPVATDDGAAPMWFTSDLGERHTGRAVSPGHVLGVGGASLTLAGLTPRARVGRSLDLGTGCGIQAAQLARHSAAVVATDVSARALRFAAFNAALAGQEWDLRAGSLFEPVAGEEFDLVVSNPPFVITPAAAHNAGLPVMEYRDASRPGDQLLRQLLGGLPSQLAPGGIAVMLGNWEHGRGEDGQWQERLGEWASGVDLWVVQRDLLDAAEYVEMWLRDGGLHAGAARGPYEAAYEAWLGDFRRRGVEAVGLGWVVVRRPVGRSAVVRVEEATGAAALPLGPHLLATLDAVDWLAARPDEFDSTRFTVAADVTVEHHYRPGEADPAVILLRQGGGLGRAVQAGTALAGFVSAADGELTFAQLVNALAALLAVDAAGLGRELREQVTELHRTGFLLR